MSIKKQSKQTSLELPETSHGAKKESDETGLLGALRVELINKKLSNESQQRAWDHYLNTRPIRDEQTDQPLGFEMDPVTGDVLRNPKTGEPKWSCCKCNSSIRSVHFNEFSDLGPGLALTFRLMQVGWKFFILAFLLSSVGWVIQLYNPKGKYASLILCLVFL